MEKEHSFFHHDFWHFWETKFIDAGYDPDYIRKEIKNYQKHSKNKYAWPEGEDDYKQALAEVFGGILNVE